MVESAVLITGLIVAVALLVFVVAVIAPRRKAPGGFVDVPPKKGATRIFSPVIKGRVAELRKIMPFKDNAGARFMVGNHNGNFVLDFYRGQYTTMEEDGDVTWIIDIRTFAYADLKWDECYNKIGVVNKKYEEEKKWRLSIMTDREINQENDRLFAMNMAKSAKPATGGGFGKR